jgi:tripartite-type tricarboxylate transporter receptor subunit TctC
MNRLSALLLCLGLAIGGAAAAQPKGDFPAAGRPITMVVPFGAGGPTDIAARLLVPSLEKELGTSISVVNKPGASTQIGVTQIATSKPDGYTIGFVSLPQVATIYLDPERKAVFQRKDLQPLAMHVVDPIVVAVRADSPHKTLQQLIDFAKANPGKLKGGTGGFMGTPHLAWLEMQRLTGARFSLVHFEGSAPGRTALLGAHIDALMDTVAGTCARAKAGEFRVLGVMDAQDNAYLPGVPTFASQGVKLEFAASRGLVAPAGTPKPVVDALSEAIRKTINDDEHRKKMSDMGQTLRYMSPAQFGDYWAATDGTVQPLMEQAKATAAAK